MSLLAYALCRASDAHPLLRAAGAIGILGDALQPIPSGHVAAIVSRWTEPLRADLGLFRAFERTVERLHQAGAVLPARFGSVLRDPADIERFLAAREEHVASLLDRIEGCDEWSVRAMPLGTRLASQDSVALQPPPPLSGADYLRRRKEQFTEADGVPPELTALCRTLLRPLLDLARLTRLEGPRDSMPFLTVHCLVPRDDESEFHRLFAQVSAQGDRRLLLTGPWPVYSFVTGETAL